MKKKGKQTKKRTKNNKKVSKATKADLFHYRSK